MPRPSIIIVEDENIKRLIQPKTGLDLTEKMIEYAKNVLNSLSDIDGFLLKARSPSCGVYSAKIYKDGKVVGKGDGFFARELKRRFPYLPIEDEGRLKNKEIRHHFLVRVFAFSELRELLSNQKPGKLVEFHTRYKFLLMTYNKKILWELGNLVTDGDIRFEEKITRYSIEQDKKE